MFAWPTNTRAQDREQERFSCTPQEIVGIAWWCCHGTLLCRCEFSLE